MFKWLADMLVKTPVQSSCSCCEGKNNGCKKCRRQFSAATLKANRSQLKTRL